MNHQFLISNLMYHNDTLEFMDEEVIRQLFSKINIWKSGDKRAPHKPLLLLLTLARCREGKPRFNSYIDIDKELKSLLIDFGPVENNYRTYYPFWRLQKDGLWEVKADRAIKVQPGGDVSKSDLIKHNATGGFKEEIYTILYNNLKLLAFIAQEILEQNFPSSIHEDILSAIGLESEFQRIDRKKRDPNFRNRILIAYEYKCSICSFSVRLGNTLLGLEAAHIKWHQANGPDIETNGLALCSIHHKLFDRGAFTLSDSLIIEVSQQVNGVNGCQEWLIAFHGKPIRKAQNPNNRPDTSLGAALLEQRLC